MSITGKKRSVKGRVQEYFVLGTERRRDLYAGLARLRRPAELRRRVQLASSVRPPAEQELPRAHGHRTYEPGTLPHVEEVVRDVQQRMADADVDTLGLNKKKQLRTGLLDQTELELDSPLMRFALDPKIIDIVSAYLGMVPILSNADIWCSMYAGSLPSNSQLYHCDWIDRTQVKVFLFCSEVTSASGPLVVLDAATSSRIRARTQYTFGGQGARLQDDEVERLLDNDVRPIEFVGSVGTVGLVDTSRCFHYGSRLQEGAKPRIMAMVQYLTPLAFGLDGKKRQLAPFRRLSRSDLSEAQRLVLGERG